MEIILHHLNAIIAAETSTYVVISMIALASVIVVRNALAVPAMAILLYPMILGIGLATNYALSLGELFLVSKVEQWAMQVIVSGTIGAIVSIALVSIIVRQRSKKTA